MNVLKFIISHWHDLLLLLVALLGTVAAVIRRTSKKQESELLSILDTLTAAALSFVTEAEKVFGDKTGVLKCADVVAKLYALIPDKYKPLFSEAQLESIIDNVLAEAKEKWKSNPNLLSAAAKPDE
jgi:hypothetical protein